jgi:hypothetical protein
MVEFLGKCLGDQGVHAFAAAGQQLIDQRDGVGFTPNIPLRSPGRKR